MNVSLSQRTIFSVGAALIIITVFMYSFAAYQWYTDWKFAHHKQTAATVHTENQTATLIASVPNAHIFGKAFSGTGDAPVSNLQFKVTGIVKAINGDNKRPSKAYISIDNQPAKIYEEGDSLPYGVTVYKITETDVIVDNDGRLEKLVLPREKLNFKPRPAGSM